MRCRDSYEKTACTFPYARTYKKESVFRLIRGKYRTTKIFNEKKELATTNSRIDYRELEKIERTLATFERNRKGNACPSRVRTSRGRFIGSRIRYAATSFRFASTYRTNRPARPPLFLHRISCNTELLSPETAALSRTRGEDIRARAPPSATSLPCSFSCSLSDSTSGPMFSAWYIAGREPESYPPTLSARLVVATRVPACAGKNAGPSR